jgi:hypothetical protein
LAGFYWLVKYQYATAAYTRQGRDRRDRAPHATLRIELLVFGQSEEKRLENIMLRHSSHRSMRLGRVMKVFLVTSLPNWKQF